MLLRCLSLSERIATVPISFFWLSIHPLPSLSLEKDKEAQPFSERQESESTSVFQEKKAF